MKKFELSELAGVFAPMVTPFKNDQVNLKGLIGNIERMNESKLRGYFVLGTNGEYKALDREERNRVLTTVVARRNSDKLVMAGCGAESVKMTVDAIKRAVDCGADIVSLLMPHFFPKKMTVEVMIAFIFEVADASEVPVMLYNNPSVSAGVTICPDVIDKVKEHPNVIGIKDSSKESWQGNLKVAGNGFAVLAGSANYFLKLLNAGGCGGVLSLANVFPERCVELYWLYREGRVESAQTLSDELVLLNKEVSGSYGVAGVKAAMDLVKLTGGEPRKPLPGLSQEERNTLKEKLSVRGML